MGLVVGFGGWSRMFRVCRLVLNTEPGAKSFHFLHADVVGGTQLKLVRGSW